MSLATSASPASYTPTSTTPADSTTPRNVMAVIMIVGVVCRLMAWLPYSSFGLDELLLARNIMEVPLRSLLTEPLKLDQVAPRGFLLAEWLALQAFGTSERSLRLFTLICGIGGFLLFARLARRTLGDVAAIIAVGLCAIAVPSIRYSAQVKQYGVDVTVAVIVLLIAVDLHDRDASIRRFVLAGLAGFVLSLFSQASVFMMAGVGLAFAIEWLVTRAPRLRRAMLITIPLWAAAALMAVVAGKRSMTASTQAFMDDFWSRGFMPLPFSGASARWVWTQGLSLLNDPYVLRYAWAPVLLAVVALGVVALWRERRHVALLVMGPLAIAMVAAIAHQYPFRSRLMVWAVPLLLLALGAGIDGVRRLAARLHPVAAIAAVALLIASPVMTFASGLPPYDVEHHRDVLTYLQAHRQPGDVVYVLPLSRMGVGYYGPRYGLQPTDWVVSACDRNDVRPFVVDVDRYRGTPRFWLLTTGALPYRAVRAGVRQYVGTIGIKRDSLTLPSLIWNPIMLELYDLSDSTRLRAADAGTFPVPPMPTDPRPGCRDWIRQ